MSRKKPAKRQVSSLPAIQKVEKELIQIPSKLALQLEKEIKSLKQKENKTKSALSKTKAQTNAAEKRIKMVEKIKHTSNGKKQLNTAKKTHSKIMKVQTLLDKELAETNKSLETVATAQAKLVALHKHLKEFEKEWTKSAKKAKVKAKTTSKKPSRKTAPAATSEPKIENFETIDDDVMAYETTEVTS